jgi:hypothetical protein
VYESLKNAEFKKLNRIILAGRDFQESLSAITFILEEMDPEEEEMYTIPELRRLRCYETTAIIAYARAFNSQRGGRLDPFSFEDIDLSLTEEEIELNHKLIDFRDEIYAHSDADTAEYHASIGEYEIRDGEVMRFMRAQHFEGTRLRWKEYLVFERLNQKARHGCDEKMSELSVNHKDKFKVFSHKMSSARDTIKPEPE